MLFSSGFVKVRSRTYLWAQLSVGLGDSRNPTFTPVTMCRVTLRYPNRLFDFLGYTFRPRRSKNRWEEMLYQLKSSDQQ